MADTSSSVKVMRAMVEAPHSCNSGSAVVLRGKRLQTSVSSYAAAGITKFPVSSSEASPFIMMSSVPPKQHPMQQTVVGTIKRLAPGQTVYVYYAIENPPRLLPGEGLVTEITYEGGRGKPGRPVLWSTILSVSTTLIVVFVILVLSISTIDKIKA